MTAQKPLSTSPRVESLLNFTLRSTATTYKKIRLIAVGVVALYISLLLVILPQAAVFAGAVTPFLAIRAADLYAERAEQSS